MFLPQLLQRYPALINHPARSKSTGQVPVFVLDIFIWPCIYFYIHLCLWLPNSTNNIVFVFDFHNRVVQFPMFSLCQWFRLDVLFLFPNTTRRRSEAAVGDEYWLRIYLSKPVRRWASKGAITKYITVHVIQCIQYITKGFKRCHYQPEDHQLITTSSTLFR